MLKLKQKSDYTYTWPVKIPFPADNGTISHAEFSVTFRYRDAAQLQRLRDRLIDTETDALAAFTEVISDWSGVIGDDDQPVPYSRDALQALLQLPSAPFALMEAYSASLRGVKAKN
jgi:hypothetical protein